MAVWGCNAVADCERTWILWDVGRLKDTVASDLFFSFTLTPGLFYDS